jgi:hypothetical protein
MTSMRDAPAAGISDAMMAAAIRTIAAHCERQRPGNVDPFDVRADDAREREPMSLDD